MNAVTRVKALCKEKKIPISRLEKDLGFSNGYIGQLKRGIIQPERLDKIAGYLGVSRDFLLYGTEGDKNDDLSEQVIEDKKGRFTIHFRDGKDIPQRDREQLADFIQSSIEQYYKLKGIE